MTLLERLFDHNPLGRFSSRERLSTDQRAPTLVSAPTGPLRRRPAEQGNAFHREPPFPAPDTGKIAIKVINHYGDEIVQVYELSW